MTDNDLIVLGGILIRLMDDPGGWGDGGPGYIAIDASCDITPAERAVLERTRS